MKSFRSWNTRDPERVASAYTEDSQWRNRAEFEQWEFDEAGYMRRREASINDVAIEEGDRRIFGARPESERDAPLPLM